MTTEQKTYPALNPEEQQKRTLIASFKSAIKEDTLRLRSWKREIRSMQRTLGNDSAAVQQQKCATYKLQVRARLLIYGFLRGRTLEQMEPKRSKNSRLRYYIAQIWNAANTSVLMPEGLKDIE